MSSLSIVSFLTIWLAVAPIAYLLSTRNQSSTPLAIVEVPTLDLVCVCGKGGTCLDHSVEFAKLPTTSDECRCNISAGLYFNCDEIVDHCKVRQYGNKSVCLNGGSCNGTFGSFYCTCDQGFIGRRCEHVRPSGVESVTVPSTFQFVHTSTKRPKKLFLLAEKLGTNFRALVDFNDGRSKLVLGEQDFVHFKLFDYCLESALNFPVAFHDGICFLYKTHDWLTAVIEPSYLRSTYEHSRPGRNDIITVTYENDGIVTFRQNFNFFTPFYGFHKEIDVKTCQYLIVFRGCGSYFNTHRQYFAHETFQVTAISKPLKLCKPITRHRGLWRYYPNSSNIYIEDESEGYNIKMFQPFTFDIGVRKIEFHNIVYGDRYHYGASKEFTSMGECTVNISRGRAEIQFVGGFRRMYPCFEPIYLQIESENPTFSWTSYEVTWSCNGTIVNCAPKKSLDTTITYEPLECGQTYTFTAVMRSYYFFDSVTSQEIQLIEEIPIFQILCVYNCYNFIQSTASARFVTTLSIFQDATPVWSVKVDGESVTVPNRTDDLGFFMPGPLNFLKGKQTCTIIAEMRHVRSEFKMTVASHTFYGSCHAEQDSLYLHRPFNIRCKADLNQSSDAQISFFVIDSDTEDGNTITEPIAESNDMIMFNILAKQKRIEILVLDPYWWKPILLANFKRPEFFVKSNRDPLKEFNNAIRLVNRDMYNGDYQGVLDQISRAAYLAEAIDEDLVTETKIDLTNKLKELQHSRSITMLAKTATVLFRLAHLGNHHGDEDGDHVKGQHHILMHKLAIVSEGLKKLYIHLSRSPNQPMWYAGTRRDFLIAHYRTCSNALIMPYHEYNFRLKKQKYSYPQFEYDTAEGGRIFLRIMKPADVLTFPVQLYEKPWVVRSQYIRARYQIERVSQIQKDIKKENLTDYVSVKDYVDIRTHLYYYHIVIISRKAAWFIGNRPFNLVTEVISSTVFDYKTEKKLEFPISTANLAINLSEIFATEGDKIRGRAKNAPETFDENEKDRSLSVWQYHIPVASTGVLYVTILPVSAKRRVYLKLNKFPSYDDVYKQKVERGAIVRSLAIDEPGTQSKKHQAYVAVLPEKNIPVNDTLEYEIHAFTLSCLTYGNLDWKSGECKLLLNKFASKIKCTCPRITWHAVEKLVLKGRQLLTDDDVFIRIVVKNFVVFGTTFAMVAFLICLFIWSIFMDKKKDKMTIVYLLDSSRGGNVYMISVSTGQTIGAGSNSSIGFDLIGTKARTGPHLLRERRTKRRLFTSTEDFYLIATAEHLGDIQRIDIWNDFSGCFPDWYCKQINVYDLGKQEMFEFDTRFWVSQLGNDLPGLVSAQKPNEEVEKRECPELVEFITNQIFENHRWISTFLMSQRNIYQHKEKVIILACFITAVMGLSLFLSESFTGGLLDSPTYTFGQTEVLIVALSLLTAYIEHLILILVLEKSNEFIKRVRPLGTVLFTQALPPQKRKRYSTEEFRTNRKSSSIAKFFNRLYKLWWCHLYAPSNYLTTFSAGNIRKAGRRKIFSWLLVSWCFAGIIIVAQIAYLFFMSFNVERVQSYKWLSICGCAFLIDAFLIDPLRIAALTACLFFFSHRRALDNYYIRGYFETRIKEEQKTNYNKELGRTVFQPINEISIGRKALKTMSKFWLSRWYTFFMTLILLALLYYTIREFDVRGLWIGSRVFDTLISEPLIPSSDPNILFTDVKNRSLLMSYLYLTLFPNLQRQYWYNGKLMAFGSASPLVVNVSDPWEVEEYVRGWCSDYRNKLYKALIVFQTRARFEGFARSYFMTSLGNLTDKAIYGRETRDFSKKWRPYNFFESDDSGWMYSDDFGKESAAPSIMKNPIRGYTRLFPSGLAPKKRLVLSLQYVNWLDNCTRSVEILFNLYEVNTDMMTTVRIYFHVSPGGYYHGRASSETLYTSLYGTTSSYLFQQLYIMICLFLWSVFRVWFLLKRGGFRSFKFQIYSVLDGLMIPICLLMIVIQSLSISRLYYLNLEWERTTRFDFYKLSESASFDFYINTTIVLTTLMLLFCFVMFINRCGPVTSLQLDDSYFHETVRLLLAIFLVFVYIDDCFYTFIHIRREKPVAVNLFYLSTLKDYKGVYARGHLYKAGDYEIRFMSFLFILIRLVALASLYARNELKFQRFSMKKDLIVSFGRYDFTRKGRIVKKYVDLVPDVKRRSTLWGFLTSRKDTVGALTIRRLKNSF